MKQEIWIEPTIGDYYDDEEKELIEDIEEAAEQGYVPSESLMTPEYMAMLRRAAARALENGGR